MTIPDQPIPDTPYCDEGQSQEEVSNCCGALRVSYLESDICSACLEHCDFEEE